MPNLWDRMNEIYGTPATDALNSVSPPKESDALEAKFLNGPVGRESLGEQGLSSPSPGYVPAVRGVTGALVHPALRAAQNQTVAQGSNDAQGFAGTIMGVRSKMADLVKLEEAQAAYRAAPRPNDPAFQEDIWKKTGWWMGPEGGWRFEVPDSIPGQFHSGFTDAAPMNGNAMAFPTNGPAPQLRKVFDSTERGPNGFGRAVTHPAIASYPELGQAEVRGVPASWGNIWGSYSPRLNEVRLAGLSPEKGAQTMLHEIQHGIQEQEGFLPGSNVSEYLPKGFGRADQAANKASNLLNARHDAVLTRINELADKIHATPPGPEQAALLAEHTKLMNEWGPRLARIEELQRIQNYLNRIHSRAFDKYEGTYGEREARNVEKRFANPDLYSTFPPSTMDPVK